jgi:hypothetical protein
MAPRPTYFPLVPFSSIFRRAMSADAPPGGPDAAET